MGSAIGDTAASSESSAQQQQQHDSQQSIAQQLEDLQVDLRAQQQRQFLRQQQQQLPTVLEDAAAGLAPGFVLVPVSTANRESSSNGRSSRQQHHGPPPLSAVSVTDRVGQELPEIQVPPFGPFLITNAPQIFGSADVAVDVTTERYDRLLLQLEVVKPPGSNHAVLMARNLSRVVRRRVAAATVAVNGDPLLPPHGAAAEVSPGDVLEFGHTGVAFQVFRQAAPAQQPAVVALQRYCGVYAQQQLGLQLPVQEAVEQVLQAPAAPLPRQQQQFQQEMPPKLMPVTLPPPPSQQQQQSDSLQQPDTHQQQQTPTPASAAAAAAAAADALELQLRNVSRLVRTDPRAAEQQLATLAADNPTSAGPWFLWAQLAGGRKRPWMARDLYRAAAVCQQQQMLLQAAADAAAGVNRMLAQQQRQQLLDLEASLDEEAAAAGGSGSNAAAAVALAAGELPPVVAGAAASVPGSRAQSPTAVVPGSVSSNAGGAAAAGDSATTVAFRLTSRLIQVLRSWGRLEWDNRLFGPSRRLWRLAANEAFKFPYEISAGGGGSVLHCWANAEFERDNILNARIIIGEALRKCPRDSAVSGAQFGLLFVAVGEQAQKEVYEAWSCRLCCPPTSVLIGNVLCSEPSCVCPSLSLPPLLRAAACVQVAVLAGSIEAAAGEETAARALFVRAYQLNKADKQLYMVWPRMEGAAGNIERARALFQAGLSLYPNNTKILNLYACFEEDQGNVELARQLHRTALDVDGSSMTAMHNRCVHVVVAGKGVHGRRMNTAGCLSHALSAGRRLRNSTLNSKLTAIGLSGQPFGPP